MTSRPISVDPSLVLLTKEEIDQLQNIDTTTISTTQWGYLGALNQSLTQASAPSFTGLTVGGVNIGQSLTCATWGIQANPVAGNSYVLCRQSTNNGSSCGFIVPYGGVISRISIIIDNADLEWTAGTIEHKIYVNNVEVYTTGALAKAAYTIIPRPDAVNEAAYSGNMLVSVAQNDYVYTQAIYGATYAGGQDGPALDLFFKWN